LAGPVEILADFRAKGLALSPPSPNPFRGSASFAFSLPQGEGATLRIYTPGGRLVRRLDVAPGRESAVWDGLSTDGTPVSPGVYLVKLETGAASAHGKAVLLR
jgi:flagellar hook assembly protein FlgD